MRLLNEFFQMQMQLKVNYGTMKLPLLESILRIRTMLFMTGKCCKDLEISDGMLKKFTSTNIIAIEETDGGLDTVFDQSTPEREQRYFPSKYILYLRRPESEVRTDHFYRFGVSYGSQRA